MKTKDRILIQAQQLFAKKGIRAITMDDLANYLGISKKTIYVNFKDKNELIINCIKANMVTQTKMDDQIINDTPNCLIALIDFIKQNITSVKSVNPRYYQDLEKYYPEIWESKIKEYNTYHFNRIYELLKKGVDNKVFRDDIDVEVVATNIQNIFKSVCSPMDYPKQKFSLNSVFENTLVNYIGGIVSDKGLEYLESYRVNYETNL
jgi:AcrR family transcriptional regulator